MVTCVIRRNITDHLLQALADTPVVLINGARQTGKSTLVQSREVADERSRQYLTFDDPGVLAAARRDPNGFLAGLTTPVTLEDRKSTRLNSSHGYISYAVFCLKKKN